MGCGQSPSSSETANVIKKLKRLRNFVSQPALEDSPGSPIKLSFSVALERSEQINADDHTFTAPSLPGFLLPASCLRLCTFAAFMCSSVGLNFDLSKATLLLPVEKEY